MFLCAPWFCCLFDKRNIVTIYSNHATTTRDFLLVATIATPLLVHFQSDHFNWHFSSWMHIAHTVLHILFFRCCCFAETYKDIYRKLCSHTVAHTEWRSNKQTNKHNISHQSPVCVSARLFSCLLFDVSCTKPTPFVVDFAIWFIHLNIGLQTNAFLVDFCYINCIGLVNGFCQFY